METARKNGSLIDANV